MAIPARSPWFCCFSSERECFGAPRIARCIVLLLTLIDRYVSNHDYGLSDGTIEQLGIAARAWSRFLGRTAHVADFRPDTLNAYLDWLRVNRAPDTLRTRRSALLMLWRYAYENDLAKEAPRKIRKRRPIRRAPRAWSVEQVRCLFDAAGAMRGKWRGVTWNQSLWTESLMRAGYDTGLRLADLLALRYDQVAPIVTVMQHKTQRPVVIVLRPATIAMIDQAVTDHGHALCWPLWASRDAFYRYMQRVIASAGLSGSFKWLRRSAITAAERVTPGAGTRLAGHAARATTEQWYLDVSQLSPPVPPPL